MAAGGLAGGYAGAKWVFRPDTLLYSATEAYINLVFVTRRTHANPGSLIHQPCLTTEMTPDEPPFVQAANGQDQVGWGHKISSIAAASAESLRD